MEFGGILQGIAGGIAVEHGKDATDAAARRVGEYVNDPEREAEEITTPQQSPLWHGENTHLRELAAIDAQQAAIVGAMLHEQRSEFALIIEAIQNNQPALVVEPFWFAAGDTIVRRTLPRLPDDTGQWKLDGFLAYTDPAAAGDATLSVVVTGVLAIPFKITAPRNNPISVPIGLPLTGNPDAEIQITPAAGGGGSANDRVCLLARFVVNS